VYFSIFSEQGCIASVTCSFSKKIIKSYNDMKFEKAARKLHTELIDGDIKEPENQEIVKTITTELS
jgi:hypothetical protein